MGVPEKIKTDNGPAYAGEKVRKFLQLWGAQHVTGIPHSPTGQTIIERMNQTLKMYLQKYTDITDIHEKLAKVLFVLNHLCIFGENDEPSVNVHSKLTKQPQETPFFVHYKDPATGIWKGPAEVKYLGRGYMCVLTPTGPQWIPSKWTKPAPAPAPAPDATPPADTSEPAPSSGTECQS